MVESSAPDDSHSLPTPRFDLGLLDAKGANKMPVTEGELTQLSSSEALLFVAGF